eukprot:Gb_19873 [translate_table: standard]
MREEIMVRRANKNCSDVPSNANKGCSPEEETYTSLRKGLALQPYNATCIQGDRWFNPAEGYVGLSKVILSIENLLGDPMADDLILLKDIGRRKGFYCHIEFLAPHGILQEFCFLSALEINASAIPDSNLGNHLYSTSTAAAMFKVFKNEVPPIPDSLSPEGKEFVRCCLKRNPAERATASQLLDHLFVRDTCQHDSSDLLTAGIQSLSMVQGTRERNIYSSDTVTRVASSGVFSGNGKQHQFASVSEQMGTFLPSSNAQLSPRSTLEGYSGLSPPQSTTTVTGVPFVGPAANRCSMGSANEAPLNIPRSPNARNGNLGISNMAARSEVCIDLNRNSPATCTPVGSPRRDYIADIDIMQTNMVRMPCELDNQQRHHYVFGVASELPCQLPARRPVFPNFYG